MTFTILDMHSEFTFTAELKPPLRRDKPIEILSMNGSHPVAQITMTKEKSAKAVNFQFPKDMDAKIKAIILGAFLFMNECLSTTSSDHSSSSSEPWANAVGVGHFGSNWGHDAGVGGGCHSGGGFHGGGGCHSGGGFHSGGDW
ncbi:uncharacterized protein LOC128492512 [Spea bombifrons]|uniref:uncharacterized protein LOC128492512 n=1 Tax=Spea bombifrons TaxID=233779 RepID=UPI00234BD81F|nr:uncharacterized protein LOC128492512 [Spea bombifrons]